MQFCTVKITESQQHRKSRCSHIQVTNDLLSRSQTFRLTAEGLEYPSKIKELHFKIVHRYYPCNLFLSRFFENISSLCSFCNTDEESILHLFYHCPFSMSFWSEVTVLISFCCKKIIKMTESIIFLSDFHSKDSNLEHTVLLLCLLGKFHLHC